MQSTIQLKNQPESNRLPRASEGAPKGGGGREADG